MSGYWMDQQNNGADWFANQSQGQQQGNDGWASFDYSQPAAPQQPQQSYYRFVFLISSAAKSDQVESILYIKMYTYMIKICFA
jgi:hypothetical protein